MADSNANKYLYSYVAAGVLALVVLALPFWVGRNLGVEQVEADSAISGVRGQVANPSVPDLVRPNSRFKLDRQWNTGPEAPQDPRWVTELKPAFVKYYSTEPPKEPIHAPPELAALECGRDAEAQHVYVLVRGQVKASKEEHVLATGVELHRKQNDEGFAMIDQGPVPPGGAYEFKDLTVVPGNVYTYKLITLAKKHPDAPPNVKEFNPAEARKESAELGPTPPVPYDLALKVLNVRADPATGGASFLATAKHWDYAEGGLKELRSTDFQEGAVFLDRYKFFPLDAQAQTVVVADKHLRMKLTIKAGRRDETPVECWPAVTPAAPPPAADADAAAAVPAAAPAPAGDVPASEPESEPEPAPAPPPSDTGGSTGGPF